jgi:Zn-dependent protease
VGQQAGLSGWRLAAIALGVVAMVAYGALVYPDVTVPLVIVLGGWIVSLTLHEFSHALVAYWGGDYTVVRKGYLTLNPLKYTHPMLSIGLPLLFLALGGIGLPGGAVYIERQRLRNKWWGCAVSIAGPFANLVCMIVFAIPFWTGYVTLEKFAERPNLWFSLACLVWLQGTAILFNLIPIPPLDGFGVIEPFLPEDLATRIRALGSIGLLLIFMMFWLPSGNAKFDPAGEFFDQTDRMAALVEVEPWAWREGLRLFRFWDDN